MSLKVTFELEDKDLQYFRRSMKQARSAASQTSEAEAIAQAAAMIDTVRDAKIPEFVSLRVDKLASLIDMLADEEWALGAPDRKNVIAALQTLQNQKI